MGKLPPATKAGFAKADAALNLAYQKAIKALPLKPEGPHHLARPEVQAAQRHWLRYRDAWVAFMQVKDPKVAPESIKQPLTEQRTRALRKLLSRLDP